MHFACISKFALEIEVLKPMFKEMSLVLPKNTAFMVMGQICIDTTYRKKGVFRKLYEAMETAVRPEFNSIITEVDAKNTRSLNAHYAIGFKDLKPIGRKDKMEVTYPEINGGGCLRSLNKLTLRTK